MTSTGGFGGGFSGSGTIGGAAGESRRFLRGVGVLLLAGAVGAGCATTGDLRKLEERVMDANRASAKRPDPFDRIAALAEEIESLKAEQRRLEGQLEVAQKTADDALAEAQVAREALAKQTTASAAGAAAAAAGVTGAAVGAAAGEAEESGEDVATSAEVLAYQAALSTWRGQDHKACIDQFRKFLQTYPASPYADDAAYWMADCHFKQGDYRVAVLRFNDVVRVYPAGNKAPDALYRQGESLLKLGPGFYDAAKTVFKQVLKEYPDSARAREASEQLEAIGSG